MNRRQKRARNFAQAHAVAWMLRRAARWFGSAEASPTVWLEELNRNATEQARGSKEWPQNANQLGRIFGELREGLALLGVELSFRRASGGGRLWRVESAQHAARRHRDATRQEMAAEYIAEQRGQNPRRAARYITPAEKIAKLRAEVEQYR